MKSLPKLHPLRRAWEAWQRGDADATWRHYPYAVADAPDDAEALQTLGYLALELEDDNTAALSLAKASLLAPGSPETAMLLGVALRRKGVRDRAVECFERALRLRPQWPDCINNLAVTLEELGRYEEALAWVERGLADAPDDVDLLNERGCLLAALGRHEEAIAAYEGALAADPHFEPARLNLADVLRARKITPCPPPDERFLF